MTFTGQVNSNAEEALVAWYRLARNSDWSGPDDLRNTYRSADPVGDEFVVFNICHNDYRLVVRIDYGRSIVYVWDDYTHVEYDKLNLRAIDEKIQQERKSLKPKGLAED